MSSPPSLADLLSVSIFLRRLIWYLPFSALCRLLQTSKAVRASLYNSPDAWRYVDLSNTKLANCCATIWNITGCGKHGHRLSDCTNNEYRCYSADETSDDDQNYIYSIYDIRWLTCRMREPLSQEALVSGPARSMFIHLGRSRILQHVQALVLDNALITAEFLVRDILIATDEGRLSVRLLSIGRANLSDPEKLAAMLSNYALMSSAATKVGDGSSVTQRKGRELQRATKGLYLFSKPMTTHEAVVEKCQRTKAQINQRCKRRNISARSVESMISHHTDEHHQSPMAEYTNDIRDLWYERSGFLIHGAVPRFWVGVLKDCAYETSALAFDAVLCRGPCHDSQTLSRDKRFNGLRYRQPEVATAALGPDGCSSCGSAPEGLVRWTPHETTADIPLLRPLPRAGITVRHAKRPSPQYFSTTNYEGRRSNSDYKSTGSSKRTLMRCESCLEGRLCSICSRWWCEYCYDPAIFNDMNNARHMAELILRDRPPGLCKLTSSSAYEIALREHLIGAKLARSYKRSDYVCVEHCLQKEVFVPFFDEA